MSDVDSDNNVADWDGDGEDTPEKKKRFKVHCIFNINQFLLANSVRNGYDSL